MHSSILKQFYMWLTEVFKSVAREEFASAVECMEFLLVLQILRHKSFAVMKYVNFTYSSFIKHLNYIILFLYLDSFCWIQLSLISSEY